MNSSSFIFHSTARTSTTTTTPAATITANSMLVKAAKTMALVAIRNNKGTVVNLAQELIRIPSVTPNDLGCQEVVRKRLERLGFKCETLQYHDVTNLWAVLHPSKKDDGGEKLVAFVGHTDVVPAGPTEAWSLPPFDGNIVDGILYGRGAVDMKGGVAAYIVALEQFLGKHPSSELPYSLGVLLTSDEEGVARWGTREVLTTLQSRGIKIDMAIVGEPSSLTRVGDVIKVGRRGSLGGDLSIIGIQGHVAYPHLAKNPIHESLGALKEMVDEVWDEGMDRLYMIRLVAFYFSLLLLLTIIS
jgi:succinyl-diaminopimelate desuccinylase